MPMSGEPKKGAKQTNAWHLSYIYPLRCLQQVHRIGSNHQLLVGGDDNNLHL